MFDLYAGVPVTDPTTLGSVAKVIGSREKACEKVGYEIPDRWVSLQTGCDEHPDRT